MSSPTSLRSSVTVGLSGGLGNQLFQYAAGRALSSKLNVPLSLDLAWFRDQRERRFALREFAIDANFRVSRCGLPAFVESLESRLSRRWARKRFGLPIFREPHFHFAESFLALDEPVYLEGYWQSHKYFADCEDVIRKEFSLREDLPEKCGDIRNEILGSDAICLHIRRGDYVSDPTTASVHGICPIEYYEKGLSRILGELENPHCFVFSDDPVWARENFSAPVPLTVVDVNGADEAHWDLALMKLCRHFVIANSSLSWWGAWLSEDAEKKVFAPKQWFRSREVSTDDLIPTSWQRI